jgi:hypothetical protein
MFRVSGGVSEWEITKGLLRVFGIPLLWFAGIRICGLAPHAQSWGLP